jgi:hypothetical protein
VAGGKPEAEHGGREQRGHHQLGAERRRAEAGGQLDLPEPRDRTRQPVALGAPQPPEAGEGERKQRRPAQQAVLAVDEEGYQPVGAVEVATRKRGVGGALALDVGRVGGGAAVEGLVDADEQRHAEQRQLDRAHRERAPARPPQGAGGEGADHHARQHELGAQPGQRPEQREAAEGGAPARPGVEADRQQRGACQRRAGGQLGIDGAAVGHERRAEADRQGGAHRPRVGDHAQGQPVGEGQRQRGDRREEELDPLCPCDCVRGQDEQRKADPVRLVQPPVGLLAVAVEVVGIEVVVGPRGVLVLDVHVAVVQQRLRRQQVVRLVTAVVGVAERVEAERGRVDAEQDEPEGEGAPHSGVVAYEGGRRGWIVTAFARRRMP